MNQKFDEVKRGRCPKVVIIILNWNKWQETIECLESTCKLEYPNYEVIVVDNGSVNDSVYKLIDWFKNVLKVESQKLPYLLDENAKILLRTPKYTLISSSENLGFSGGNNLAIEYAINLEEAPDFIFLLNNDARIDKKCLKASVQIAISQNADIVGALIKSFDGKKIIFTGAKFNTELFWGKRFKSSDRLSIFWEVDRVEASGMLISRRLLLERKREKGYFLDPSLFLYYEETEFCAWAKMKGYKILMTSEAVVYHHVGSSLGSKNNPLFFYYLTRNWFRMSKLLLPWWLKLPFYIWYPISRIIRSLLRILKGQYEVAEAILSGLIDGYRGIGGKWTKHPNEVKNG